MSVRILLIDDDEVDRMAIRRALRQTDPDTDIQEAADGASGVRMAREGVFDCMLLDYRLPDMDGLACLTQLSAGQAPPPIVMLNSPKRRDGYMAWRSVGIPE
jgi:CheY-like chemotaxis protein